MHSNATTAARRRTRARRIHVLAPVVIALVTSAAIALTAGAVAAQGTAPQFGNIQESATGTSVTVTASVNPEGADTTYLANYGTTPSYGSSTPSQDAGSGTSFVTVTVTISGLSANAAYDVQLALTNAAGTTAGPNMTVSTTAPTPSTVPPPTTPVVSTPSPTTPTPTKPTTAATSSQHLGRVGFPRAGMPYQALGGVACVSSADCFAVGSGGAALVYVGKKLPSSTQLIAHRTGTSWSIMASPRLAQSALNGITCASATDCMAVGRVGNPNTAALAEHWNGRGWTTQKIPAPVSDDNSVVLFGVACASASECFAVGGGDLGTSDAFPIILRWNGVAWAAIAPATAPRTSFFNAVSCLDATDCYAVGDSKSGLLIEHWNGRGWAASGASGVAYGPALELNGISCRSAAMCWAVGTAGSGGPLLLRMSGGRWHVVSGASFLGGGLQSVACASTRDCWAVGSNGTNAAGRGAGQTAVAENFNGTEWLAAGTAKASAAVTYFTAVACPTAACVAVGGEGSDTVEAGLVETAP
ncbi:MAG TPA: hypothetical protein VFG00_03005 [Acidothermaceae bacterium]|nr:hypothetical protein [Acidothermaceae bacterium]